MCLEPILCSSGFFGGLCNFPCHCKDSADCTRDGRCSNGCHEAWYGPTCSTVLPYRSEPPNIVNQAATTLTFDVTWVLGENYGTGTITNRKLSYRPKSSQMDSFISIIKPDNHLFIVIDNLTPNMQYQFYSQFSRMVDGIEVDGPRSTLGTTNTICSEPLEEPGIELKANEEYHVVLSLKPVSSEYDRIQCNYILRYQVQYSDIDGNIQDVVNISSSTQLEVELSGLSSCTDYVAYARVINNMEIAGNWGENITVQTAPSVPSIKSTTFGNGSLLIKWNTSTCDILDYHVTYHYELSGDGLFQQGNTTKTEVLFDEGIESCIEYTFTVLASYLNGHGTPDTKTFIFGTNCNLSDEKKFRFGLAWISLLVSFIVVVIILMILKRRTISTKETLSSTNQSDLSTLNIDTDYQNLSTKYERNEYAVIHFQNGPVDNPIYTDTELVSQRESGSLYYKSIELSKLHDYVMKRQLSIENGFEKEFKESQQEFDDNKVDIVPGSEKINASYVDGWRTPREFIACEGPTFDSFNDMMRLIWNEKSRIVIMITNLIEGKQCKKYWPYLGHSKELGNLLLTNVKETDHKYYVLRNFKIQQVGEDDVIHNVYQYHFTEWSDKSVSSTVPHLLDFIKQFRKTQLNFDTESGPVIVHSSGGGRSGTMIAIAAMLDMSEKESKVDVFNFVRSMRQKCIQTVETKEQYAFIYAVLLEELFCGQTVIPVGDIQKIIQNHKLKTSSIFEYQLRTLNSLFPPPMDCLTSHGHTRQDGNKSQDVLFLTKDCFSTEVNSDDDVNASFIEHCKENCAYIVTRTPLADDTSVDFWRLIFDYKSDVIVQLNEMEDLTSTVYFPNEINQRRTFGEFTVTVKSTHQYEILTKKKIIIEKAKSERRIILYEVHQWPKHEPVPEVDAFVKFIMTIMQRSDVTLSPITVHCRDGVCRSGLFCLVYTVIQEMQDEKVVDVFQTLKALRSTCPTMVDSEVQYNFCYDIALCYMKTYQELK
ncbi:receptor-type tyrosine-protein phosphatase S-like isoform X2 [Antedon mediterranea]|uniref:receptor-type tyrosine-protein phosphatase S-like isoform X2 n=1 Tax=Antedon mediterranea TaxID=105859 RepID=UPI003AF81EFE